jgi:hypothetical protein
MLSETDIYVIVLFFGAFAVPRMLMFVGCSDDPVRGDTGLEIVETGIEAGDTGIDTGGIDTSDFYILETGRLLPHGR